jgi:undecaprenyl-diphosphatase
MGIFYKLHDLDARLFSLIFRHPENTLTWITARSISRSADGYLLVLTPLLLAVMNSASAMLLSKLILVSILIERCIYLLLKNGLRRKRPGEAMPGLRHAIQAADRFSFPSGHTSAAFVYATALVLVYTEPVFAVYLWACAVGLSRVILGAHYPGDTLAGAAIGTSVTCWTAAQLGVMT